MSIYLETRLSSLKKHSTLSSKRTGDKRNEFETDYDRVIISAPIRRLADKTQVFPQEINDSVRTRLTHSHEVSNLCRSIVLQIFRKDEDSPFGEGGSLDKVIPIVTTVGLAHDVGNPPFGHMGEVAIGDWINKNIAQNDTYKVQWDTLTVAEKNDFLKWEGNAQAFRLLSKLQLSKGNFGLDLTAVTMAALMKYTVPSDDTEKDSHPSKKKFGYFQDDAELALKVLNKVKLTPGLRHPLAYIMEACDDIAYSVIDIEDGIKKKLISLNDVIVMLKQASDTIGKDLAKILENKIAEMIKEDRDPTEIKEISVQYFRSFAIGELVVAVSDAYVVNKGSIIDGTFDQSVMDASKAGALCDNLKKFAFKNIYKSREVVELEVKGANLIHGLMAYYWQAIVACTNKELEGSFFEKYVFECISSNYRAVMQKAITQKATSVSDYDGFYEKLLLLTDMISGMTEDFAERTLVHFKTLDPKKS